MIEVVLILENDTDIKHYICYSGADLEDVIKSINFKDYIRCNILFYIDDEISYEMTKIYKERYLPQDISR